VADHQAHQVLVEVVDHLVVQALLVHQVLMVHQEQVAHLEQVV
jgi:hypothetical protein